MALDWLIDGLRRAHRWLRPDARNALAVALMLVEHDRWPRTIGAFTQRRVVVLAPHPDDEAIGCAGAILSHLETGARVTVIQLSDGRWGDRRLHDAALSESQRNALQAELITTRRAEAQAWAHAAGCQVHFLEAHDGMLGPRADWALRLAGWLNELQPEMVYLPFVGELHEDHWQTNRLFDAALRGCTGAWVAALLLRSYEVWSPVIANRVLDVTALAARKRELLGLYASQLRDIDYRPSVAGLNTWRALLLPQVGQGQAEAYFESSLPAWRDLLRQQPTGARRQELELRRFRGPFAGPENDSGMPTSKPLHTAALRQQVVELAMAGRGLKQLAREFGVSPNTIRDWVVQARAGAGPAPDAASRAPLSPGERQELIELRRKLRQVQHERDILAQKATA